MADLVGDHGRAARAVPDVVERLGVQAAGIEVQIIGDAREPRKIGDAIREGFEAALAV